MALLECDVFSEALGMGTSLTVLLPQSTSTQIGVSSAQRTGEPPLLYLLHGLSDDHTAWLRYTSIERYAADAGMAVVMPAVGRSFYADEAHGHRYWTYVCEELPRLVASLLRVTGDPARTFVAGLSMGGYGALKLALRHPDRFAAAASLSGALDLGRILRGPDDRDIADRVFGGRLAAEDDLLALVERPIRFPRLWVGCGTDDELHPDTVRFVERARTRGHEVTVDLRPGGHEWTLWDAMIARVIPWLVSEDRSEDPGGGDLA